MGNNSHLGAFCYVNVCFGTVTIGDDVAIGPGTKIIAYSNHYQYGKKITEVRITEDVTIGNNVFIGANCIILPGTIIPDNTIVGAGSVVKGKLESNSIYGGVPCKRIKTGWYE
ncbi:MAG: acyltransferase [bacterium]